MPGLPILRNPGVACVWVTRRERARPFVTDNGPLFEIGEPEEVRWYVEGRQARRAEVERSIKSGMPALQEAAAADGQAAERELGQAAERVKDFLPA